ncbi:UDP-Glc/Gal endoplasmic reticulum nucleotide sugar transporter [Trichophaea hybrida]|nr:UDP-Glc/Gal endoplasmic reticulum nucleotide sugar transporter [Trichophaea hybrida]
MARRKQLSPQRIVPSSSSGVSTPSSSDNDPITEAAKSLTHQAEQAPDHGSSIFQLIICVGGIYASFLIWALLQERITTTSYGPDKKIFRHVLVLNTVQSLFASLSGYAYFRISSGSSSSTTASKRVFPGASISFRLLLVALTQTLASPFGYASLKHIDYITYILAKSCKLLPVMFLHVTLFRRKYPLYKYLVVAAVSAGVAVFTLYPSHPKKTKKSEVSNEEKNVIWGMMLLMINLLFDGLTNTIQDDIFAKAPKGTVSGPQMMAALNTLSSVLTSAYLVLNPWSTELMDALAFIGEHPKVGIDILGFAFCGAVGQVFIFYTLAKFGSLVLVTVTVTRKMLSMVFSVVAFGHSLSAMQMLGVGLVFFGIGAEAEVKRRSDVAKKQNSHMKTK